MRRISRLTEDLLTSYVGLSFREYQAVAPTYPVPSANIFLNPRHGASKTEPTNAFPIPNAESDPYSLSPFCQLSEDSCGISSARTNNCVEMTVNYYIYP